jgi:hypothetical protein
MKRNKDDVAVQYMDNPRGDQQCDRCTMYIPGGNCTAVLGPIINAGWCRLFKRKAWRDAD